MKIFILEESGHLKSLKMLILRRQMVILERFSGSCLHLKNYYSGVKVQ